MQIQIDVELLEAELAQLANFSDVESPAVTRVVFSEVDLRARAWLKEQCRAAGLKVREDGVGNTFARWNGSDPQSSAIGTGSHIDAIPSSGRYDGTVGVLGGLEAIRCLMRSGFVPARPIELLVFTSEEPTRFGIGCLGSRMLTGSLDEQKAGAFTDKTGASLDEIRKAAGFAGALSNVRLPTGYYAGFIELHIEQGPLLERAHRQIGVVTSIAAPASIRLVVHGEGGHAGAVLMPQRRDALTAAAEIILKIESLALGTGAIDTVATTGNCDVFPGAVNSIPSRVTLAVDVRDIDLPRRDSVIDEITAAVQAIALRRRVKVEVEVLNADDPARCDPKIVQVLEQACRDENLGHMSMVSRAYHDSLFMSRIAPTAMLFIPCRDGISHRPEEFASIPDISMGARILARALATLAS